ncbi:MAG: hypothetical protein SFU56_02160 [Capsulimonadales bacterium]|nr:hypothetical protein [Capsulimonadales bacterium]
MTNKLSPTDALQRLGDYLLKVQTGDGALPIRSGTSGTVPEVVPQIGNHAIFGLVDAFRATEDRRFLQAIRQWIEWRDRPRNADRSISTLTKTTDSEGTVGAKEFVAEASYIELLHLLTTLPLGEGDRKWLQTRLPFARRSIEAALRQQQKNGLVSTGAGAEATQLIDNVIVLRGLLAGTRYFQTGVGKERGMAVRCTTEAVRLSTAISTELWDPISECYRSSLRQDNRHDTDFETRYPDLVANLLAIGWLPRTTVFRRRAKPLYERIVARLADSSAMGLPRSLSTEQDLDRLVWWGFAAEGQGDTDRILHVRTQLARMDPVALEISHPSLIGLACRLIGPLA